MLEVRFPSVQIVAETVQHQRSEEDIECSDEFQTDLLLGGKQADRVWRGRAVIYGETWASTCGCRQWVGMRPRLNFGNERT